MTKPPPPPPAAPRDSSAKDLILAQQRLSLLRLGFLFFGASLLVACDTDDDAPTEYAVGTAAYHLVDPARAELETPDAADHRELIVRAYYPAQLSSAPAAGYFLDPLEGQLNAARAGLPDDTFATMATGAGIDAPVSGGRFPVLVFSTGLDMPASFYTYLLEDIASGGYVVLAISHPYKAGVVVFPDHVAMPTEPGGEVEVWRNALIATWSADQRFVVDWLTTAAPPRLRGHVDLDRIGVVGHSLGGGAAAQTCLDDARITACSDLDGSVGAAVRPAAITRPFLLMRADGPGNQEDTLAPFYAALGGPAYRAQVDGGSHYTFSDLPAIVEHVRAAYPGLELPPLPLGAFDAARSRAIVSAYATAFFDEHLRGRPSELLAGASPTFPEVVVERNARVP